MSKISDWVTYKLHQCSRQVGPVKQRECQHLKGWGAPASAFPRHKFPYQEGETRTKFKECALVRGRAAEWRWEKRNFLGTRTRRT